MSEPIKQSGGKQNLRTYNMNRSAVFNAMLEDYRDLCRHNSTQAIAEITDRLNQRTFDNAPMFEVSFRVLLAEAHDKKENYVCAAREIKLAEKVYRAATDAKGEGTDTEAWGNLETIMTELNDLMKASEAKGMEPRVNNLERLEGGGGGSGEARGVPVKQIMMEQKEKDKAQAIKICDDPEMWSDPTGDCIFENMTYDEVMRQLNSD